MTITLADIEAARRTIAGQVMRTPMLPAPKLSELTGADGVRQIREPPGHELVQGARRAEQAGLARPGGACAGRHRHVGRQSCAGRGLSCGAAWHSGHHCHAGDDAVREGRGDGGAWRPGRARGRDVADAQVRAEAIARERGLTLVHPYDDPLVIAGQGTIALEMLEEAPDLDMLVIPIGGGGLIAGNAIAARAMKPSIEIIGAEAALYPSMWNALGGEDRPIGGADAGRRHCRQERRRADAADRARTRLRHCAG